MSEELQKQIGTLTEQLRGFNELKEKGILTLGEFKEREEKLNDKLDQLEAKFQTPKIMATGSLDEVEYQESKSEVLDYMRSGNMPEESKAIATDDSTTGGAYLRPAFSNKVIEYAVEMTPIMQLAEIINVPAGTTSYEMPREADDAMAVGWVGERESRSETDTTTTGKLVIPLSELYALPKISQKALNNKQFNFEAWLREKVARKFALTIGTACVSGDGSNKPLGFLNNSDIDITTSGTSSTFDFDDLITVQYELLDQFGANASWMMKRQTARVARTLKDGNGSYIWQPGGQEGQPATLLGDPVYFSPDMAALASGSKSIAYGDFKQGYAVALGDGMKLVRDPYSSKPFVEFYFTKELGGQVKNAQAMKILQMKA